MSYPSVVEDYVKQRLGSDYDIEMHYCRFVKNSVQYFTARQGEDRFGPRPVMCRSVYVS
jgi:hypothetical protein